MRAGSKRLQASATARAPGVKKGRLLHRLSSGARMRKVRAANRNSLGCTQEQSATAHQSDVTILNREPSIKRLIGVCRADPPAMAQVRLRIPFVNQHRRQEISSRSFKTLEESACGYDAAAIRIYGGKVTTNRSLGFISEKVRKTKVCRQAAGAAQRRVDQHRSKVAAAKLQALVAATTDKERRVWRGGVSNHRRGANWSGCRRRVQSREFSRPPRINPDRLSAGNFKTSCTLRGWRWEDGWGRWPRKSKLGESWRQRPLSQPTK